MKHEDPHRCWGWAWLKFRIVTVNEDIFLVAWNTTENSDSKQQICVCVYIYIIYTYTYIYILDTVVNTILGLGCYFLRNRNASLECFLGEFKYLLVKVTSEPLRYQMLGLRVWCLNFSNFWLPINFEAKNQQKGRIYLELFLYSFLQSVAEDAILFMGTRKRTAGKSMGI